MLFVLLAVFGVILSGGVLTAYTLVRRFDGNVGRINGAFDGLDEKDRPAEKPNDGLTFLLLGPDTRSKVPMSGDKAKGDPSWPAPGLTDVIMLFHVSEDRSSASIVSIPRDSWVEAP